ncbi:WXG100 family type VII secretion target [Streptomyces sp. CBMA29]|uniref:WXG100 family type VII secretion target n=1 Tax=Streptomyces sp. CBMA29 TaxID=1896314 RepID=UPI00166198E8|nr:hypothetical protein [Streptomyces sp. CBMA29]MBD0736462.1 hypothetical protein [Streptomyces sp. CBMA29]
MADSGTADYDTSVLNISPTGLKSDAADLVTLSKTVLSSLTTIRGQLEGLHVAWQGQAASDADEVNRKWVSVMTELFGTEDDPHKGVLSALADGVGGAAYNYTTAEDGIADAFKQFRTALTSGDGKTSDNPPDAVTDPNKTAVTMEF